MLRTLRRIIEMFFAVCALYFSGFSCALELPHGVPLSRASFYNTGQPFKCLDGSAVLPWSKVNNNYCDCSDGSDEPGTAACNRGVFFCRDTLFKSVSIPSMFVNDGICDCCDGSDEYDGASQCESNCGVLAAAVREAKSMKRNEIEQGHRIYKEYVAALKVRREEERIAAELEAKERAEREAEEAARAATAPPPDEHPSGDTDTTHIAEEQYVDDPQQSEQLSPEETFDDDGLHQEDDDKLPTAGDRILDREEEKDIPPALSDESPDSHSPTPAKPIDYGPEEGFHMLADLKDCLKISDRQYTYMFCAFREVTQNDLVGSDRGVSLGHWDDWERDQTTGGNPYSVMRFTNGQGCWNGPARSTKVYVQCGPTNELLSVAEPSRCEYELLLRTPAACFEDPEVLLKRMHPDD